MKIHERHERHGAAILQIAEDPEFTTINAFRINGVRSVNAYTVNDNIGVYLKYGTKPRPPWNEYTFGFQRDHLDEIEELKRKRERTFIALICWQVREVCCLSYDQLRSIIDLRREAAGVDEDMYTIYVQALERAKFRVYVSPRGVKNRMLGAPRVARNAFPSLLFASKGKLTLVA